MAQGRFSFCGVATFSDNYLRTGKTKSGNDYKSLNFRVDNAASNGVFVEQFGMVQDKIKTMDSDNQNIEFDWDDRNDKEVIDKVANYRKNALNLGDNKKSFVTTYDFISAVEEEHYNLNGQTVMITGQVRKDFYNGTCRDKYDIQNVYVVQQDSKKKLEVTMDFYFNKDSIDAADWKTDKCVVINGYTPFYDRDSKSEKMVNQQITLDASKLDFDNEQHVKILNFKLKQIGLTYEDDKIKNALKSGKIYKIPTICSVINGQEEVPFDENSLTANQKMSIELGIKKLEDFRPKGATFGERVTKYKLVNYDLRDEYDDGCIITDYTEDEFDDLIYTVAKKQESLEEVVAESIKDEIPFDTKEESVDDLFG